MGAREYDVSFRCYFPGRNNFTTHRQMLPLTDVRRWVEAYRFTHPNVKSMTIKVWFDKEGEDG